MTPSEPDQNEEKSLNEVYYERNLLALAFIRAYKKQQDMGAYGYDVRYGWWPDDAEEDEEDHWAVVWVDTGFGQVGWHIPTSMVPRWLHKRDPQYDGYTTPAKNERVSAYIYGPEGGDHRDLDYEPDADIRDPDERHEDRTGEKPDDWDAETITGQGGSE